jgi:Mn-dependent DtxR family transcriptional regulator|tara:strand:- start:139 stop:354 length:216 start_codon:yes stop_codon:yes gene_type:complete
MGQQDVYDLLKKYKSKWLNAREIANLLDASFNTVVGNLKRLRKAGIVVFKKAYQVVEPAGRRIVYLYRYKK